MFKKLLWTQLRELSKKEKKINSKPKVGVCSLFEHCSFLTSGSRIT